MRPTYDGIVNRMKDYFAAYNAYAQCAGTVHRMDEYFHPEMTFIPYMWLFGGPDNAIQGRQGFYEMLTGHPDDYERFEVEDVFVDLERLVTVARLRATVYDGATHEVKVRKHYLPLYELVLDEEGSLKIKTIHFFWEASPPEVDARYSVDRDKWGERP